MIDFFALLNEPRRPWLNPHELKAKFLALSSEVHPDRVHNASEAEKRAAQQRYTDLNAAYQCLREPRDRLKHLLELETGAKPAQVQAFPAQLMDLSLQFAKLCGAADAVLGQKQKTLSPLLQVEVFERGQDCALQLIELLKRIQAQQEEIAVDLRAMDEKWQAGQPNKEKQRHDLAGLEEIYRRLSYLTRWSEKIQERVAQLAM